MKLSSNFAILDVQRGRRDLKRYFENGGASIPVTIKGFVTGIWGRDDGISQEFTVQSLDLTRGWIEVELGEIPGTLKPGRKPRKTDKLATVKSDAK